MSSLKKKKNVKVLEVAFSRKVVFSFTKHSFALSPSKRFQTTFFWMSTETIEEEENEEEGNETGRGK